MNDLGGLSQCMLDGDGGAINRTRRVRGKALAASAFLEVTVIVAMLLWPLITPAVLPTLLVVTPVPPYYGVSNSSPAPPEAGHPAPQSRKTPNVFLQPPSIPAHVSRAAETETTGEPLIESSSGQGNTGAGIPGIDGTRTAVIMIPPAPEKPRMISRGVMDASLIHCVQPEYPAPAKMMRLSGIVQLRAVIGTEGDVRELEVVSGNSILARAAVEAVRQWRYQPTRLSGVPVEVQTQITVTFVLE